MKTNSVRKIFIKLLLPLVIFMLFFFWMMPKTAVPVDVLQGLSGGLDMHVHLACINEDSGCYVSDEFREHKKLGLLHKYDIYMQSMGVSEEQLEKEGDQLVAEVLASKIRASKFLSHAVILALDGVYNDQGKLDRHKTQVLVPNIFIENAVQKHSEFYFGASVNPNRADALAELERVAQAGAVLIKWIPCIMDINPADRKLEKFYHKMIELDLPLLSHAGHEGTFMFSDDPLCDPLLLDYPLSLGVKVIAAHAGDKGEYDGQSSFKRFAALVKKYPNLYADNSSLTQFNKLNHMNFIKPAEYQERVIYGSDWPLTEAKAFGVPLVDHKWHFFKLSKEWRDQISVLDNSFDKDIALKLALGMPKTALTRVRDILQINQ